MAGALETGAGAIVGTASFVAVGGGVVGKITLVAVGVSMVGTAVFVAIGGAVFVAAGDKATTVAVDSTVGGKVGEAVAFRVLLGLLIAVAGNVGLGDSAGVIVVELHPISKENKALRDIKNKGRITLFCFFTQIMMPQNSCGGGTMWLPRLSHLAEFFIIWPTAQFFNRLGRCIQRNIAFGQNIGAQQDH